MKIIIKFKAEKSDADYVYPETQMNIPELIDFVNKNRDKDITIITISPLVLLEAGEVKTMKEGLQRIYGKQDFKYDIQKKINVYKKRLERDLKDENWTEVTKDIQVLKRIAKENEETSFYVDLIVTGTIEKLT